MLICLQTFIRLDASNYYWVGGSGNWSDLTHWATSSGGSSLPAVVPGITDDVFFDANSGFTGSSKTVILNVIANCRHITCSGASVPPTFSNGGGKINIYGSSVWQTGMTFNVVAEYKSSSAENVRTNGVKFGIDVKFSGPGSWNIKDSMAVAGTLYLDQGTLNTGNFPMSIGALVNTGSTSKVLNLGSSVVHVYPITSNAWLYNTSLCSLNAGTSTIIFETGITPLNMSMQLGHAYNNILFRKAGNILGGSAGSPVTVNKCVFQNNGSFSNYFVFDSLCFNAGFTYAFQNGVTQKVNEYFYSYAANCDNFITINSFNPGLQASINTPSTATIIVQRNVIQDINYTGSASFVANGSFSTGNCSNITFVSGSARDIYWVGGTGNYEDKNHWSSVSGGSGGYCIPGPLDNVFFDGGSGFTGSSKTISMSSNVYCHNITCSGAGVPPVFTIGNSKLNIAGSSVWQTGMTCGPVITYISNQSETITSNAVNFISDVTFSGNGSWTLQDSAAFNKVFLYSGTVITNNKPVSMTKFIGTGTGTNIKTLYLGSSRIHVVPASFLAWNFNVPGAVLYAGTSTIIYETGSLVSAELSSLPGHVYYNIKFNIVGTISGGTSTGSGSVSFHNAQFNNNGTFNGYTTFDSLMLSSGYSYSFLAGATQRINNYLYAYSPACVNYININSTISGTQATINAPSTANVLLQRTILQDIYATGGASYTANTSVDLGNNNNISFNSPTGQNLYWVGGTGNFDDKNHWAASSGGAGGYCVPGPGDDVFFDANSGFTGSSKTVRVNINVYCHNITCAGSAVPPVFFNGGGLLNIFGSSIWQAGMTYGAKTVYCSSSSEQIRTNAVCFDQTVTFSGLGNWSLQDSTAFSQITFPAITMVQGTLYTNNKPVSMIGLNTSGTLTKTLNLGNSTIHLTSVSTTPLWFFNTSGSTLIAGTSTIIVENGTGTSSINSNPGHSFNKLILRKSADISGGVAGNPLRIKTCVAYNNCNFIGANTIDSLLLSAGFVYTIQSGFTLNITKYLEAQGNPCFILYLRSSISGSRANVCVSAGPTTFNFADVKDINASCQTLSFSDKSTNSGNNSNITFAPYNSGVLTPLGPDANYPCSQYPYPLSASGFFPSSSTNLSWSNGVSTVVNNVAIAGKYWVKVTYSAGCIVADTIVLGYANPIPVLVPANKSLVSKLYCDYGGKKYYMGNTTTSSKDKAVLCLIPNGNTINPDSVIVDNSGTLTSSVGGGTFSNSGSGYYQSTDGSNTFRISKRMYTVVAPGSYTSGGGVGVRIYYTAADTMAMVSDAFPGGIPLTSEGWYKCKTNSPQTTLDSLTPKDLLSGIQIYPTARGTEAGVKYVEFYVNNFSTFGYFTSTVVSPLPVKLIDFKGEIRYCHAELSWSASMETNFSHYEVEFSNDAQHWSSVGRVTASKVEGIHQYTFHLPQSAEKAYYRLKMVDLDETFNYSASILIENTCSTQKAGIDVYPNPFDDQDEYLILNFQNIFGRHLRLNLVDASGRVVLEDTIDVTQSNTLYTVSTEGIQTGVYFLRLYGQDNKDLLVPIKLVKF